MTPNPPMPIDQSKLTIEAQLCLVKHMLYGHAVQRSPMANCSLTRHVTFAHKLDCTQYQWIHECTCVYVYVYLSIYRSIYVSTDLSISIVLCLCMHACRNIHICSLLSIHISHIYIHINILIYNIVYIYIYVPTRSQAPALRPRRRAPRSCGTPEPGAAACRW